MIDHVIDLRSDTVTKPTAAMRRAMADAPVGDDVFREDPTVDRLERKIAEILGKESAMFVPSGTMSNQIALRLHAKPGEALICEADAHIFIYEAGGPAVLSGITCVTAKGPRGIIDVPDVEHLFHPVEIHYATTRLLCLENTHNRGGGTIYPLENIDRLCAWAHGLGLATHLDGARLMNASIATKTDPVRLCRDFDTISVCFSKGLGAPVGSALAGTKDHMERARFSRKLFGGGMRQAGIIAAAACYALDHHVDRLAEDHENAQIIAQSLEKAGFPIKANAIDTNIIWVDVPKAMGTASDLVAKLREKNILSLALGPQRFRLVTHLDVSRADAEYVARIFREAMFH